MIRLESPKAIEVRKKIVAALSEYAMIEDGDKVMVGVSGGKDSAVLLTLLQEIRRRAEINFELYPVMLDQKQPGFNAQDFKVWVSAQGMELTVLEEDTYSIVKEKIPEGKTYCSLCSRLRRGILYNHAKKMGFDKIALGHHRDDTVATFLLNLFYQGRLSAMPPKLLSDDGQNIVIRPLCFVREEDIRSLAEDWKIPLIPCKLCGSQEGLKREKMAKLVKQWRQEIPGSEESLFASLSNVCPSQLMDPQAWNFAQFSSSTLHRNQSLDTLRTSEFPKSENLKLGV